jgi:hypothetical protein
MGCIVVELPRATTQPVPSSLPPSDTEAWQIAKAIRSRLLEYVALYDTKKYWPDVYRRIRREFRHPKRVAPVSLRDALLWKYGHLGKPAIPAAHEFLIAQLQRGWPAAAAALPRVPEDAFNAIERQFGGKTRFITVAFSGAPVASTKGADDRPAQLSCCQCADGRSAASMEDQETAFAVQGHRVGGAVHGRCSYGVEAARTRGGSKRAKPG